MASVRLEDVIDVKVFSDLPPVNSKERTALVDEGIISTSAMFDNMANAPGDTGTLPFWKDLDSGSAPNISTDDPAQTATPAKVTQGAMSFRKAQLNKGWSAMDLARELAMGDDAMIHIRNRDAEYWNRQLQRRVIATANGILASNVANNSGDMVYDASTALSSGVGPGNVFTRGNFTSAQFTLGDAFSDVGAIAVHSVVYKRMVDSGDVVGIRPFEGAVEIPTYLGKRIIVDDGMPFTPASGANAPKFTSIIFGREAFAWGNGSPTVPVELERKADAGNGAGEERIWVRKTWIIQPFGYKTNDVTPGTGNTYSLAELATAALWTRVVERKNVPIAFLITNG